MAYELNDVRVLRNILGDGKADEDPFLTRELPKFKMKRLPKKDMYGRNLEEPPEEPIDKANLFKKFGRGFQQVEHGYFNTVQKGFSPSPPQPRTPGRIMSYVQDSRSGFIPNWKLGKRPVIDKFGRNLEFTGYTETLPAGVYKDQIDRKYVSGELVGIKPTEVTVSQERAEPYTKYLTTEEKTAAAKAEHATKIAKLQSEARQKELEVASKELGYNTKLAEYKKQQSEIDALQQSQAVEVGRTPIERFFKSTQRTISPLVENLSTNIGGGFAGQFQSEAATKEYSNAVLALNSYMEYMKSKYKKKGIVIREEYDIIAVGTAGEKKRIQELKNDIQKKQGVITSIGFLSGGGATAIRNRLAQTQNLEPFTQVSGGSNLGSYTPEAFGRLGVSQGLRSIALENKWGALIGSGGGADKITQLLGKGPDPSGAREKLKRYL